MNRETRRATPATPWRRRPSSGQPSAEARPCSPGAAVSAAAAYFARRVVTPDRVKPDDVEVLTVGAGHADDGA